MLRMIQTALKGPAQAWAQHRQFYDALFAAPATEAGAERWDGKEVRLGIEHALYLRWL